MDWETLDSLIQDLEWMLNANRGFRGLITLTTDLNWKDIWAKVAEVQTGFKSVRYPTANQREQAWHKFNALRDDAAKRSQEDRDSRRWKSESRRSEIMKQIESARPNSLFGFDPVNVEDMKSLGQVLKEAVNLLTHYKHEMLGEHKQECYAEIKKMREIHDAWWNDLKSARSERKAQRQSRIRANLDRNYERLRKAKDALERHRSRADDLRSQISSAWNDDWRYRAEGWLSELEDKIADIERSIDQIEDWIREDEDNLE